MDSFSTTQLCGASGWAEKNLRNALERGQYEPRGGKTGGRYRFTVLDVADASIMRHLVQVGATVPDAAKKSRDFVDRMFAERILRNRPITLEELSTFGQGYLLEIRASYRDLEVDSKNIDEINLSKMNRPDLVQPPANQRIKFNSTSEPKSVFLVGLNSIWAYAAAYLKDAAGD